jgi:hypothetical protein
MVKITGYNTIFLGANIIAVFSFSSGAAIPDVERQKCFSCGKEFFDHTSNEKLDAFRRKSKAAA